MNNKTFLTKLKTHYHHNEQQQTQKIHNTQTQKKIHKTKTQTHRKFTIPKPTATPQPRPPLDRLPKVINREWGMRERGTNWWWERNPRERAIDLTVDGQNQFKEKKIKEESWYLRSGQWWCGEEVDESVKVCAWGWWESVWEVEEWLSMRDERLRRTRCVKGSLGSIVYYAIYTKPIAMCFKRGHRSTPKNVATA